MAAAPPHQHSSLLLRWTALALLTIALAMASLRADAADPLRIGVADNYAPLSDAVDGAPQGFLIDLIRELEGPLGRKTELICLPWPALEQGLATGAIDLLFGLYYSDSRADAYAFGPDIFSNKVYFYVRPGRSDLASIEDAGGTRVALAGPNSYLLQFARENFPETDWIAFSDFPATLAALEADPTLVGFIEEESLVGAAQAEADGFRRLGGPLMERSLRPVCRRDRAELMQTIAAALEKVPDVRRAQLRLAWMPPTARAAAPTITLSEQEEAFLAAHPKIRYASDPNWAPISFLSSGGELQGMQHDYLQLIARNVGLTFELPHFKDWPDVQRSLSEGRADFRSGAADDPRSTIPYRNMPLVLATRIDSLPGYRMGDFAGRRISIEDGNPYTANLAALYPKINFISAPTEQNGLAMLFDGEVDGHVGNYAVCAYEIQRRYASSLTIVDTIEDMVALAFVVSDDPEWTPLIGILNKGISAISEAEEQAIHDRWLSVELNRVTDLDWIWKTAAAAALCLAIGLAWRLSTLNLRRALVAAKERILLANKAGAGGQFEWLPHERKVTYSPEFFQILGYERDELAQEEKTLVTLTHPDDFRPAMARQLRCTREGKEYEHTLRMRRKDGNWAWIALRGVPTHWRKDGSTRRYIGVQIDVTELQVAIEKLQEQQEIARQASQAKSAFLANMSHEIRTPMNAILGFSRLLKRDPALSMQQKEYVHLINSSSEHLLSLLDDILDMAKIESRRLSLTEHNVDLKRLLAEVAAVYEARCKEKGLHFDATIEDSVPARIVADGPKVRQVTLNLLSNAVKFTDNGMIALHAYAADNQLRISISDTGCGISEEEQARLFEPFSQGSAGLGKNGGTGLGLAICREFCRLMGGDIVLESEKGKGSNFIATLPYVVADEPTQAELQSVEPIRIRYKEAASKSLLVVDDKLSNLQYMDRFLSEQGFNVRLAQDGEAAIVNWKLYSPDLILLDLRMPKVDGYEVVRRIRSDRIFSQPRILALTASAFNDQKERVLELGADAFMTKPFDENKLLMRLAELLELAIRKTEVDLAAHASAAIGPFQGSIDLTDGQRAALVDACRGGYVDKLERAIATLSENQPAAADHLRKLARNFDYDRILSIATQAPDRSDSHANQASSSNA